MSQGAPPVGDVELVGRITTASNATFLARIGAVQVVYKPTAGERQLWDFPDHTLARRELATYLVSETLGWDVVPQTWLGEGPFGEGMLQRWCEPDGYASAPAVRLVADDEDPGEGWLHVLDALDGRDRPVSLWHEDSPALRRMAVLDVVTNNADRKGAHVLERLDGHRYGVDHGLTFNTDPRLRTILWGWMGEPLTVAEADGVARLLEALEHDLGAALGELLEQREVDAFAARCERLRSERVFPAPEGDMPAIPWPPL